MKFLKLDICASEISRNKEATKKITNKKINWLEIYQEIWNNRKFLLSGKHHKILKIYYYIRHEKSRSFLKYLKFVENGSQLLLSRESFISTETRLGLFFALDRENWQEPFRFSFLGSRLRNSFTWPVCLPFYGTFNFVSCPWILIIRTE